MREHSTPFPPREISGARVAREGASTVVFLSGEHDSATRSQLDAMLATASRLDRAEFVLDVSNLEFFDGAIVDVFLKFHRYLALQSRRLVLRGVSPTTARILDICEVSHVLTTIYAPAAPAEILLTGVVA